MVRRNVLIFLDLHGHRVLAVLDVYFLEEFCFCLWLSSISGLLWFLFQLVRELLRYAFPSIWFRFVIEGAGNDVNLPNTSKDGTSPFVSMVSFIALMVKGGFKLLSRLVCKTLNYIKYSSEWVVMFLSLSCGLAGFNSAALEFDPDVLSVFMEFHTREACFSLNSDYFWDSCVERCAEVGEFCQKAFC